MTAERMLGVFDALVAYGRGAGFPGLRYKAVPYLYQRKPANEDLYGLYRSGARLVRRDVSFAVDYVAPGVFRADGRPVKRVRQRGVVVARSGDFAAFHAVARENLEKYGVEPVHSREEIALL